MREQYLLDTDRRALASQAKNLSLTKSPWKQGDPPTPDPRPVGYPARGAGQWPGYRNCYDLNKYPLDEYSEDRRLALRSVPGQTAGWTGGHYIPGATIRIEAGKRFYDPPFTDMGHPAHVSETKIVVKDGKMMRIWADGAVPHS